MSFKFNPFTGNFDEVNDSELNASGYTITRNSEELPKITSLAFVDGKTINYTYDAYGKISSYTDGTKTWTVTRAENGGVITAVAVT